LSNSQKSSEDALDNYDEEMQKGFLDKKKNFPASDHLISIDNQIKGDKMDLANNVTLGFQSLKEINYYSKKLKEDESVEELLG
jgi:hypothetical protein